MLSNHNADYSIITGDYIARKLTDKHISKIKYKGKLGVDGLYNYNNPSYINIAKAHYHVDRKKEWKHTAKSDEYDQTVRYAVKDFGYTDNDLIYEDKTVDVIANWIKNPEITIKATDQSKRYDGTALTANSSCSVTSGSLYSGDKLSCSCSGSQTEVGSSSKTITSIVIKDSEGYDVTYKYDITKVNGTLTVTCGNVITGTLSAGQTVSYGGIDWTVLSVATSTVKLAANSLMGHGSYDNAKSNVTSKLKNESSTIKKAIDSNCATVVGSDSNTTNNLSADKPYWLTSGKVRFPDDVKSFTTTTKKFAHGYSGVVTDYRIAKSGIVQSIVTGCSKDNIVYKKNTTYSFANSTSSITITNGKCDESPTVDLYSDKYSRYNPYKVASDNTHLYMEEQEKNVDDDGWDFETKIGNCYEFRWQICGGTYSGKYLYARHHTDNYFYVRKTPGDSSPKDSEFESKSYGDNDNKYIFFAG